MINMYVPVTRDLARRYIFQVCENHSKKFAGKVIRCEQLKKSTIRTLDRGLAPTEFLEEKMTLGPIMPGYWCQHCSTVFLNYEDLEDHTDRQDMTFKWVAVREVPEKWMQKLAREFEEKTGEKAFQEIPPDIRAKIRQRSGII